MNRRISKRAQASIQLVVMLISVFAFSYMVYQSSPRFEDLDEQYKLIRGFGDDTDPGILTKAFSYLVEKISEPMIPTVSAQAGVGCCLLNKNNEVCSTTTRELCADGSRFADGALCSVTSFCITGCCIHRDAGTFDNNVLRSECQGEWDRDHPTCDVPGAEKGCCMLSPRPLYNTLRQCEIETEDRATGESGVVDWRGNVGETGCTELGATQEMGACVLTGGNCKFITEQECLGYNGQFSKDYLCTSPDLETSCEKTDQTTCIEGKDGVYFLDSCGNPANIYDSNKKDSVDYWNKVASGSSVCGAGADDGNAGSKSCGNCDRFNGGICASALENNVNPDLGNFFCKDSTCTFDGENYENGESWCVYDGKIGDGDDVVGSRHWKYVCNQGEVQIEPCADYRNQICVQRDMDIEGSSEKFSNAACRPNNWRECIDLNSQEGGLEKCEDTLDCRVEKIDIADKFHFDICTPKHPGGFSFEERYQKTAQEVCGFADQTCTVIYKQTMTGSCVCDTNCACEEEGFAQQMNDFCRKMGDCGLETNIAGKFTENYEVLESPRLSKGWIDKLVALSIPVKGQMADPGNTTKYLEAAGLWGGPGESPEEGEDGGIDLGTVTMVGGLGMAGVSYALFKAGVGAFVAGGVAPAAVGTTAHAAWLAHGGSQLAASPAMSAFAGSMIAAGIGMFAGAMIAKMLGLSPIGSTMMSIGAGMLGMTIAAKFFGVQTFAFALNPIFIWAAIILILVSLLFMMQDCEPVEVVFTCKPWQPPVGGGDCEICNEDPLKPCSEYRCKSLGAACSLINKGTDQEICIDENPDDSTPPALGPQLGTISSSEKYSDIKDKGFGITSLSGGCVDAYTPLLFGIVTDEPAYCKFDIEEKEFDAMSSDLGGNNYIYNHSTTFNLPDPSHGQSQGLNWKGDLTMYIKCKDTHGFESPGFYTIDMCVYEGPDRTPPRVQAVEPANDALISFDAETREIMIYTNELSDCSWDTLETDYSLMANPMTCEDSFGNPAIYGYKCTATVPTTESANDIFVRCQDQPWLDAEGRGDERNSNTESFVYKLRKPEEKIKIDWIEPSSDFESPTRDTPFVLKVKTSGGGEFHSCDYSLSGYDNMIEMFENFDDTHEQPLTLRSGTKHVYVECKDETGDSVRGDERFRISYDSSSPQVARIYQQGGRIKVITTESAECVYSTTSCSFRFSEGENAGDGEMHTISAVRGNSYYVKCKDEFGNTPSGCSIIARAL
jgi:hypothetical protein